MSHPGAGPPTAGAQRAAQRDAESPSSVQELRARLESGEAEAPAEQLPPHVVSDLLGAATQPADATLRDFGERYSIRAILGEGGQGVVLSAHDHLLDREVALKALKEQDSALKAEYLEREARLSGILEHPNIPPTYDLGRDETHSPYFVMRKVEGTSLSEILRRHRRLSSRDAGKADHPYSRLRLLSIFDQVCHAIEYAHSRGVLHLDIKPQNVKLGPFGEVFVLDWGFAARKDERPTVVGGTPIYIAPERLRHEVPDERADIYSLGILLYRILSGKHPYDVKELSFEEYRERFESLEAIPPRRRDRSVPPELDAIVMKAIAKEPGERYQSVHALAEDLQRFLDGVPVTAFREGLLRRSWKTLRRHSVVSTLAAALVVALGLSAVLVWRARAEARAEARAAEARREARERREEARLPFQKAREFVDAAQTTGELQREEQPNLKTARAFYSKAIAVDDTFAEAFFERGKVHRSLGNMHEALVDFRRALALNPSMIMAHYYAGTILMDGAKDLEGARRQFEAMRRIDPQDEYSLLGLARLHILAGRYEEALRLCRRIEERNPSLRDVWDLRGFIYARKGSPLRDPQQALAAYNRYLETPSRNDSAYANRGLVRQELGDIHGALRDYDTALAINPHNVYALTSRGYLRYAAKTDIEGALADFERALMINPHHYWTYMEQGAVYEYLQRWEEAEESYNWAYDYVYRRQRRRDPTIPLRLGQCFFRQGKFALAEESFTRALEDATGTERARLFHRRGVARYAREAYRGAEADFTAALESGSLRRPFYAAMMRHLVRYRRGENPDPAPLLDHARAAAEEKPWLTPVARYWGGNITRTQALAAAADQPAALCEVHFYVAMADLLLAGETEAAQESLRQALAAGRHLYAEHRLARLELARLAAEDKPPREAKPAPPPATKTGPAGTLQEVSG